ncbi:MAG: element excision factor XisH family protein [Planctomycetota bacterium]|jgi:hypothetical protein|nr:element excision factor XisH family protein [Planctomycetota bacterium]MDP6502020.1 element excision factor XisH family protein [Planctomycetota bacterium]
MAQRDLYHHSVVRALQKDNWLVTDDPLTLEFAGKLIGIDLGAEKLLAAEREGRLIAVEVKSFQGSSDVSEFHMALGQMLNYRLALEKAMPDRVLYLAVPDEAHSGFFQEADVQEIIRVQNIKILVYEPHREEILQWIE